MTANASKIEERHGQKGSTGKKRIEAIEATFYESGGTGKGEKAMVRSGRGTGTIKMPYSNRRTVVTIVEDSKVQQTIVAIRESATTGIIC